MTDSELMEAVGPAIAGGECADALAQMLSQREVARLLRNTAAMAKRLRELLPPADDGPPFDAWSFVRDVLNRGASIECDSQAAGRTYEQFSARLDAAARELADQLKPHLKPTEPK